MQDDYDCRNPDHVAAAKAHTLEALAAGLPLKIGKERPAGVPRLKTINCWRATDAVFAAAVENIKRKKRETLGRRAPVSGSEGKAAAIVAVRAGHSMWSLAQSRPEGCPHVVNIAKWRKTDPHFAREFLKAIKERGVGHARRRLWLAGVRKYTAALPDIMEAVRLGVGIERLLKRRGWSPKSFRRFMRERPKVQVFYDKVVEQRGIRHIGGRFPPCVQKATPKAIEALRTRATRLARIVKETEDRSLRKEIDRLALIAARNVRREEQVNAGAQRKLAIQSHKAGLRDSDLNYQASLLRDRIYAAAEKAVSKQIEPDDRADIITDIVMAVLQEEIAFDGIAVAAKSFVSEHYASFKSKKVASLDEERFDDSDATLLDTLTTDEYDYAD